MSPILFWFFTSLMLIFALAVIFNRNPVASALSLVVSFIGLAALFIQLDAYFIGTIQILVYAGAVMVLFLFIIMLLDLKAEQRRKLNLAATAGGIAVVGAFTVQLTAVLHHYPLGNRPFPSLTGSTDDVRNVGAALFTSFNLPFQVVGVLILVSTIGVIVLSKRELK
ncbi:MAG: NADH-quinone oxidoreductase subunit J [Verrucomicrobiota bacterium]